jgi:hypothetical protein
VWGDQLPPRCGWPIPPLSVNRNLDLGEAAGRGRSHGRGNRRKPVFDEPPSALCEDYDRDLSTRQILLVANVSIDRDEHIESSGFRGVQQFAILEGIPPMRTGLFDGVIR